MNLDDNLVVRADSYQTFAKQNLSFDHTYRQLGRTYEMDHAHLLADAKRGVPRALQILKEFKAFVVTARLKT